MDAGYPRTISPNWGWGQFGANGIDAALYSGSKCYFNETGISLTLERTGAEGERKSIHMHFHYALFAEIVRDLAKSVAALSEGDIPPHRAARGG